MNRQEANRRIISILGNYPTSKMLEAVDFGGNAKDYRLILNSLQKNVESLKQFRFVQILWAMGLNLHYKSKEDRFYEESVETLNILEKIINN